MQVIRVIGRRRCLLVIGGITTLIAISMLLLTASAGDARSESPSWLAQFSFIAERIRTGYDQQIICNSSRRGDTVLNAHDKKSCDLLKRLENNPESFEALFALLGVYYKNWIAFATYSNRLDQISAMPKSERPAEVFPGYATEPLFSSGHIEEYIRATHKLVAAHYEQLKPARMYAPIPLDQFCTVVKSDCAEDRSTLRRWRDKLGDCIYAACSDSIPRPAGGYDAIFFGRQHDAYKGLNFEDIGTVQFHGLYIANRPTEIGIYCGVAKVNDALHDLCFTYDGIHIMINGRKREAHSASKTKF